jgi:hypothetical protein
MVGHAKVVVALKEALIAGNWGCSEPCDDTILQTSSSVFPSDIQVQNAAADRVAVPQAGTTAGGDQPRRVLPEMRNGLVGVNVPSESSSHGVLAELFSNGNRWGRSSGKPEKSKWPKHLIGPKEPKGQARVAV